MKNTDTTASTIKSLKVNRIIAFFMLATVLYFATAFNIDSAIAASNKSETTYPSDDRNLKGLLYSDSDKAASLKSVDDFVSPKTQRRLLDATQIPAEKQPILDRSDPDAKLLEKAKQMFKDAGNFSAN